VDEADRPEEGADVATNELAKLASAIERQTIADGGYDTAVPALRLSRFSAPSDLVALVYEPSLCVVAQGAKEVLLADETYRLDPAQFLLVSIDLPVAARVVEASADRPYLAVRIALDPAVVGELLADGTAAPPLGPPTRAIAVTGVEPALLDAISRLVALLDSPQDVGPLAPLVLREITYRVLAGPQGGRLRQIAAAGAPAQRIARAIRWLKDHFAEPLRIESLAKYVRMSPSAFHLHFKSVTALSPLQYQKRLRLQESRRLMLGEGMDAAEAAFRVGYESPSQFSREYRRMFGAPPRQDVAALKIETQPAKERFPRGRRDVLARSLAGHG
jgi:AraC-like DNA-binding protein